MGHGTLTGTLQAGLTIGFSQADDVLFGSQSLQNLVTQKPIDDLFAMRADVPGQLVQPLAVTGKEPP